MVNDEKIPLICEYCRISATNRVERIEALMKHIVEEYSPWLNMVLIWGLCCNGGLILEKKNDILDYCSLDTYSIDSSSELQKVVC